MLIQLFQRGKKDFSKPIDIKLDFLLLRLIPVRRKRNAYEDFCKYCPILDPHKPTSAKLRVPFATGCGEEDICRTDIRLLAEIVSSAYTFEMIKCINPSVPSLQPDNGAVQKYVEMYACASRVPLVLGDQNALAVAIAVENLLDPAFLARVIIEAPHFLVLVRMPSSCRETSSPMLLRLDCDVGNPLNSQIGLRNITVELDVEEIPGNTTELVFNVSGTSAGQEQMPGDNHKLLSLDVRTLSDIRMTGTSSEDMVYFRKAADSEDEEITIVHSYEVRNYGPSKVDSVELMFTVPVAMLLDEKNITFNKLYSPKASLAGQPFPCSARDYDFLRDSSSWTRDAGDELDSGVLESSSRKRRSVDDVSEDDAAPANGTLYLSCEQEQTICATVVCAHVGPFRSVQTSATAQLSMSLQLQQLGEQQTASVKKLELQGI
ncbi:hypothetical protein PR048_018321 [Dryococelus australis]|uniref:Integrin alpha-2 domain-containing protein n=1 Tax=Dryococelus australis TaxID=614101 RepID=A0ABQ9HBX6_9NEOP|nr:hypothetical protein PR048_018321 [Dryococelus australis]